MTGSVRFLSAADIAALALPPEAAREAVASLFRAHYAGRAHALPKLAIDIGPGHAFQSLCAASTEIGLAANKWLGMTPASEPSVGSIHALIALNNYASGQLVAILDGGSITAIRTAAMSAAAAQFLARGDSRSIGFVGCGLQARAHLSAMGALLPTLRRVLAFDGGRRSTRRFAGEATAQGFDAVVLDNAEQLVRACDILVTSVPMRSDFVPFLAVDWIAPGAFIAAIDVARSFLPDRLRCLDIVTTDDHEQQAQHPIAPDLGAIGTFDADLSELAAGAKPGRTRPDQRTMFVFRGFALADLAVAALALRLAEARDVGTTLLWGLPNR